MEKWKKVDWLSWAMLILGSAVLLVVGWYGLVFVRSYGNLRLGSEKFGVEASNLSMYLFENGWMEGVVEIESFKGMVVSKGECLRLWDGRLMRCYKLDDKTLVLIFLDVGGGWVDKRLAKSLENGGWVEKRNVVVTNEKSIEVFVSDPKKVRSGELMRVIRFGDIVRVVINVETQEVLGVVMVHRGGLI